MRLPNSEQKVAIEHHGGVLLSAGAGSGKTFVLVEHIVYLIHCFAEKNRHYSLEEQETMLRSYLSSIVMMTFTKKAAGELSLRLRERMILQQQESDEPIWILAANVISSMFVGTIHGFCNRLLQSGYFLDLDPNYEMITETQLLGGIEKLFRNWYEQVCKVDYKHVRAIVAANAKGITNSLVTIFGDPTLRILWKESSIEGKDNFFEDFLEVSGLGKLYEMGDILSSYSAETKKGWYKIIESFQSLKPIQDYESFKSVAIFFDSKLVLRGPRGGQGQDDVNDYLLMLKDLRTFIKNHKEDLEAYEREKSGRFQDWFRAIHSLVSYVEDNYDLLGGITFSDLEYTVLNGVRKRDCAQSINKSFKYFIIDEFQDTSQAQFEIISRIVDNDLSKIFCVGDLKQAIYGFRGGELGVFLKCQNSIDQNLTLTNNYRSHEVIINFNNALFENIFKKGFSFLGSDPHAVPVDLQTIPIGRDFPGRVSKCEVTLTNLEKIRAQDFSQVEALELYSHIEKICKEFPHDSVCILYKKLAPAAQLINRLINSDLGFTAQVKVPLGEDPIIGIALRLLEEKLEEDETKRELTELVLQAYFNALGIQVDVCDEIDHFYSAVEFSGFVAAFQRFIYKMGLSNSNYRNNIKLLEDISKISRDDIEEMYIQLRERSADTYSIEFQKGKNPGKISIMTTHASKGLEFDHVLLGGIHNNAKSMPNRSIVGKIPASIRWKEKSGQRKAYKSPNYILEELVQKQKDFAESKRLFYVAGTRAVKTIFWADIFSSKKAESFGKESWINGIRSWEDDGINIPILVERKTIESMVLNSAATASGPLFHKDSLGIYSSRQSGDLFVVPELSVTRLASIVSCPRKFYLQNVCKISDKDLDPKVSAEENIMIDELRSSATRGTEVHDAISGAIMGKSYTINEKDRPLLDWVLSELEGYRDGYEFVSEIPMKFPVSGVMVTGIPDLVLNGKNQSEIWDFKTGRYSEEKVSPYWFQLQVYAHAIFQRNNLEKIDLVLAFLDERKLIRKTFTKGQIAASIIEQWSKLGHFDQVNDGHCSACQFSGICHD